MTKPRIKENIELGKFTTFKIGGPARYFLEVRSQREMIDGVKWAEEKGLLFFILAGGSNLLVADKGFSGLVIKLQTPNYQLLTTNYQLPTNIIHAEAGVRLSDLVALSLKNGLSGLEWAAGIPRATIGGAVWGNAGAFGRTIGEIVEKVEVLDSTNYQLPTTNYSKKDCGFGYKDSIFKRDRGLVILSADLVLGKKNKEEVKEEVKKILKYRKDHHPIEPSAGSVFKNIKADDEVEKLFKDFPEAKVFENRGEVPAGWLIERCGLKGKKINGAQISPKHANFIVNTGSAQAEDVVKLIKLARQKAREKFGVALEEEIQYVGF